MAGRVLRRRRIVAALVSGGAVLAWLAVIVVEVAVPETQYRAASWVRPVAVAAWLFGAATTVGTALLVPPLVFPGVGRAAHAVAAATAAVAALVPAVTVGDLSGFDARRYHERHRAEFAQLAGHLRAGGRDLPPGLAHLSVTGAVEQPGGIALAVLPQRTGAAFVLVGDATATVGRVPVGGADRTVRYFVGDGWWWAD